jgi:hypothetical protein
VGNAHSKLLACPSFAFVSIMQNGEVGFMRFSIAKMGNAHSKLLAYPSFDCASIMRNGELGFEKFPGA